MITEILRDLSLYTNIKLTSRLKKLDINVLKNLKEYLDDKYYNTGEECEFTDDQYDRLKDLRLGYEKKEKSILEIGAPVRDDNNRVKLPYWLGSIDKIKMEELPTQEEIEKEAIEDLADYEAKIKKRICALKHLNKRDKILEKVMEELPSAHDLFHIMMSYRIYKTEDRTRIRRPSDLVISIAKVQENNGKNVDNMTKV